MSSVNKNVDISHVAEPANVTAMTVTRTFNGKAPVAQQTRERILDAARKLGYRPNLPARTARRFN